MFLEDGDFFGEIFTQLLKFGVTFHCNLINLLLKQLSVMEQIFEQYRVLTSKYCMQNLIWFLNITISSNSYKCNGTDFWTILYVNKYEPNLVRERSL